MPSERKPAATVLLLDEITPIGTPGERLGERIDAVTIPGSLQHFRSQPLGLARLPRLEQLAKDGPLLRTGKRIAFTVNGDGGAVRRHGDRSVVRSRSRYDPCGQKLRIAREANLVGDISDGDKRMPLEDIRWKTVRRRQTENDP